MKFETITRMSIISKASNLNSIALLCECPLIKIRIFVRNCAANYDISLVGCKNEHIKIAHSNTVVPRWLLSANMKNTDDAGKMVGP